ncbi:MAG: tRNA (adenine-N1)-methyltransferase [Acidimicrobiales bacterium]
MSPPATFQPGERALFIDSKNRRRMVVLKTAGELHTHAGITLHDDVLGRPEGISVVSTGGARHTVLRPTLADFVLAMPRGAQVIYPKDLGPILMLGDISPGLRVLEAGVGSGALSMTLLRAGAQVVGYELREDFAKVARRNVEQFLGPDQSYEIELRDVYDGIDERGLDRVLLDLAEPWRVVKPAAVALRPGGLLLSYLPTVGQVAQLRTALEHSPFGLAETVEVLQRGWYAKGQSLRPDHRMVAHTGFLTVARLLEDRPDSPPLSPPSGDVDDVADVALP